MVFGFFLFIGGVILSFWIKSWLGLFWPLLGVFSLWQAVKRFRQQGPQIKIGRQGIWSVKTDFLPWGRTLPIVKMELGYRSVSTYLVLLNRFNQHQELAKFNLRELDIDVRTLKMYINELAPKF
ncbi:hypothetical protein [Hymenobacter cheonanensis]|uniref:hypothetical protein n=1 Tax=Hymenobacter sp. CA2-7 TaxID=3063993 RepID=UPI00272964D8|nr:hypothetical protein [Hymenobacter sp. CA2-7]